MNNKPNYFRFTTRKLLTFVKDYSRIKPDTKGLLNNFYRYVYRKLKAK